MISYIEGLDEFRQGEDIQHYGRIGMKWYQHRFGEEDGRAAYIRKGFRKVNRYYDRAEKNIVKSNKDHVKMAEAMEKQADYRLKSATASTRFGQKRYQKKANKEAKNVSKYESKFNWHAKRYGRNQYKAEKVIYKMERMFGEIPVSQLRKSDIQIGREYCMKLLDDSVETAARQAYLRRKENIE